MELRQLQYFVTVAQHGSFTRAAQLLHLTQPGVSSQIRQLERELGHPLLDRSGRTVRLTPAGEAVLPHARAALASAAAARRTAAEFGGLRRGHVRLGMVAGAALTPPSELGTFPGLATTLAAFRQEHPGIDFSLAEDTTSGMLAALREGRLDLAVIGLPTAASGRPDDDGWTTLAGLTLHTVLEVPLVAACPEHHPLADVPAEPGPDGTAPDTGSHRTLGSGTAPLPVAALDGHALVSTPRGTGLRTALERALAAAGASAAVGVEAAAPPQLAELAAHGLGVAVLPDPGAVPGLRVRPLAGPVPLVRIALAWPSERPAAPPTAALVSHLRTAYPGPAGPQADGAASAGATAAPSPMCRSAAAPSRTSRSSGK
ncbi:LysR family transcriptional regulator [Kitasatospora xanthocidica]|uniref:LysR family transcriptional regulator n=1 Tax=Kitasatospora xanthocidica TaxID=83382 RepID=UPI001678C78A|nr:LysR family transcriptional regulator [Kitasatospora xanthocidica]GHF67683.1 LysR family transcriptional regulator [Kitasatospora xanthocidica]